MGKIAGDPTSQAPSLMVWCRTRCCVGHPCRWVVQGWLTGQLHGVPPCTPPSPGRHSSTARNLSQKAPAGFLACPVGLSCSTGTSAGRRASANTSFSANGGFALALGVGDRPPQESGQARGPLREAGR